MRHDVLNHLKPRERELVERYPTDRWHLPIAVEITVDGKPETRYACRLCAALQGLKPEQDIDRLMQTPQEVEEHMLSEHNE